MGQFTSTAANAYNAIGQPFALEPGESEVHRFFNTLGGSPPTIGFLIGIILVDLIIGLPLILIGVSNIVASAGFAILIVIGLLIILGTTYFYRRKKARANTVVQEAILTNMRAVVAFGGVVQQLCILEPDVIPVVSNLTTSSQSSAPDRGRRVYTTQSQWGRVTFLKAGQPLVVFDGVPSPQEVANTVLAIIRSRAAGTSFQPPSPPGGGPPGSGSSGMATWSYSPPK